MLISIVIPCHNSSETIHRAVESVFLQTWKNWELILVNNNSTDATLEVLNMIKLTYFDKNIKVLNELGYGAPAARNKGLFVAKGDWIQFLDADDELLPEKLEMQASKISDEVDAIYSPYNDIINLDALPTKQSIITNDPWEALLKGQIGITSSNLFRKKALIAINGWDENVSSSQDTTLAFHLLRNGSVFLPLDTILTNKYSLGESTITNTTDVKKIKRIIDNYVTLRKEILVFLRSRGIYTNKFNRLYDRAFADIFLRYFHKASLYTWLQYNKKTKDVFINRLKTNYSFAMLFKNKLLKHKK